MSLNWDIFKNTLGHSSNTSVAYIDDEGSEIPIDSDCEFQEALRLAKINKKHLKVIIYKDGINKSKKIYVNSSELVTSNNNSNDKCQEWLKDKKISQDQTTIKENISSSNESVPPEWFTHYMNKFKSDLLYELKLNIIDIVEHAIEKEKKLSFTTQKSADLFCEKNEIPSFPLSLQSKKKKKVSEKESGDLTDQRDMKFSKKLEKLHPTKSERLLKLDNKVRLLLEEKKKLLEKKRHCKPKLEKNGSVELDKKVLPKKSFSFLKKDVFLFLRPGEEFTLNLKVINDGKVRWTAPRFQYFDISGLYPKEITIRLPKLSPTESCLVAIRGKASTTTGLHCFRYRLVDNLENIGPEYTCRAQVDAPELHEKCCSASVSPKKPDDIRAQVHSGDTLNDFGKILIASSQKKIKGNIKEIERRLQDLDSLRLLSLAEKAKVSIENEDEVHQNGCDSLPNLEPEKSLKKRLEQEEVLFGVDCLQLDDSESVKACAATMNSQKDKNEKIQNLGEFKKEDELESSSDSDLSVIFVSEEGENFIMVPLPLESPSPAESIHEGEEERSKNEEILRAKNPENIPKFDPLGNVIYAVSSNGYCLPVKDLFKNEEHDSKLEEETSEGNYGNSNQYERGSELFNDFPAVNILPNVFTGASNIASSALNTAKTVISNLHSAFVTEGKTELGQPAYQYKEKVSKEAMVKLCKMGFTNVQINRKLLLMHDNDISKVVEELVQLEQSSSN